MKFVELKNQIMRKDPKEVDREASVGKDRHDGIGCRSDQEVRGRGIRLGDGEG